MRGRARGPRPSDSWRSRRCSSASRRRVATSLLLADTWTQPTYAHLDLRPGPRAGLPCPPAGRRPARDGPDLRGLVVAGLVRDGPSRGRAAAGRLRQARLRPGDLHRAEPGRAPGRTCSGRSTATRRLSRRSPTRTARERIVLARRDDRLGLFDASAADAATRPGRRDGRGDRHRRQRLGRAGAARPGRRSTCRSRSSGATDLEIRVLADAAGDPARSAADVAVRVIDPDGAERSSVERRRPATRGRRLAGPPRPGRRP